MLEQRVIEWGQKPQETRARTEKRLGPRFVIGVDDTRAAELKQEHKLLVARYYAMIPPTSPPKRCPFGEGAQNDQPVEAPNDKPCGGPKR
jgi:hypothetical protein